MIMPLKYPLLLLTGAFAPLAVYLPAEAETRPPVLIAQTTYPTTEIPCPEGVPPGEIEGETITCGILTVPENYDEPDGRQIDITYAVLHSHSLSPAPDPVIDLRGGPGGTIVGEFMEVRAQLYDSLRRTRDVVLFDQRGTKYSNELLCGPTQFVLLGPLETVLGEEDIEAIGRGFERFQPMFPEVPVDKVNYYAVMGICAEVLEAHGVDLSQYNSPNNAQDTVNLAIALGYDDINLYGISYGTYLAQQIMRDHPDRLRSVVLDSTVTAHVNKYEISLRASDVVLFNLIDECTADVDCAAAYPDLRERTIALVNSLAENPIPLASPVPHPAPGNPTPIDRIDPDAFIGLLALLNKQAPQVAPYVPLLVHELEQGITTTFAGLASGDLLAPEAATSLPDPVAEFQLQAEDLRVQAEELLRAEAALAQTQRPASQWVQRVRDQIATLPEAEQFVETANFYGIGYQSGKPRNRETLLAYVNETFEGDLAQALTADVNALSEVEVRHVYEIVSAFWGNVIPLEAKVATGMFRSFDCREGVAFSDRAATEAVVAELAMPALAADEYVSAIDSYNICQVWPVEPAPAREHTLLESDIPTLVLQGRYDTQTNSEEGRRATEGLSNGRYVEFSSAGHMVFQFSDCAKDIGVAFINNPGGELNTSCTEALVPEFVLPPSDE
jgi:pimeloyl-ACP methyl ester carboxylesterase